MKIRFIALVALLPLTVLASCRVQKAATQKTAKVAEKPFGVTIDSNDTWKCQNIAFVLQDYPDYTQLKGKEVMYQGKRQFIINMDHYNDYILCGIIPKDSGGYRFEFSYKYFKKKSKAEEFHNEMVHRLKTCLSFQADTAIDQTLVQENGLDLFQTTVHFKGTNAPTITMQRFYNRSWARYEFHMWMD